MHRGTLGHSQLAPVLLSFPPARTLPGRPPARLSAKKQQAPLWDGTATACVGGPPKELCRPHGPCHGHTTGHTSGLQLFLGGWSSPSVGGGQTDSHLPLRSGYQSRGDAVACWPYPSRTQNQGHCLYSREELPQTVSFALARSLRAEVVHKIRIPDWMCYQYIFNQT